MSGIPESSVLQRVEENGRAKKKSSGKVSNAARSASNHLRAVKPTPGLPGDWDWVAHNHDANLRDKSCALPALGRNRTDSWKELCVNLAPCTKCSSSLSSDGEGKRTSKVGGLPVTPGIQSGSARAGMVRDHSVDGVTRYLRHRATAQVGRNQGTKPTWSLHRFGGIKPPRGWGSRITLPSPS